MFVFYKAVDMTNFMYSLKLMGQGMVGIFVVMFVIHLVIVALNKFGNKNSKK